MKVATYSVLLLLLINTVTANDRVQYLYDQSIRTLRIEPDSSIYYAQQLLEFSRENNSHWGIIQANFILGWQYEKTKLNAGKGIIYYLEGIRSTKESKDPEVRKVQIYLMRNVGDIFLNFDDFQNSLDYFEQALELSTDLDEKAMIIANLRAIGDIYKEMEKYDRSIQMFDKAHEVNLTLGNKKWELEVRNSKGNALKEAKRYHEALHTYETNLEMVNRYGKEEYSFFEMYATHNIAEVQHKLGSLDRALDGYEKAVKMKENKEGFLKKNPFSYYLSLSGFAQTYWDLGDYTNSIHTFKKVESFIEEYSENIRKEYLDTYIKLAEIYESLGQFETSNEYRKKHSEKLIEYLAKQQEVNSLEKYHTLEQILARYDTFVQQEERSARLEYFGIIGISAFLLVIASLILYSLYQRYRLKIDLEHSIRIIERNQ